MAHEPLGAEFFREAVGVAVDEAKREGKIFPIAGVAVDAIIDELKKNALGRECRTKSERGFTASSSCR
jgi:hypothetical protein